MKKYLGIILCAISFYACSRLRTIELTSLSQSPCKDEALVSAASEFADDSVSNLEVFQKEKNITASMEVTTFSNSRITFDIDNKGSRIRLKLRNFSNRTGGYVCKVIVTTSFKILEDGNYNVLVTNEDGKKTLASTEVEVK